MHLDDAAIHQLRVHSGINEHHRHLHRLLRFGLVAELDAAGDLRFSRTDRGEQAINAVRQLERRLGKEAATQAYRAALGPTSMRLFLRVYGDRRDADREHLQVRYTPEELGRLSVFLPRVIDGMSAIDKLNEADRLVYQDDNHIHMQPVKARGFYKCPCELYRVLNAGTS